MPTIQLLTQKQADDQMKSLDVNEKYYRHFYEAFHDERRHVSDRERLWALPEHERSYYLIESYLFGINLKNPDIISLSSFARILLQTPHQNCASCLKLLLRRILLPMGVTENKRYISAALTKAGRTVFEELKKDFPRLQFIPNGPYHLATIPIEDACP